MHAERHGSGLLRGLVLGGGLLRSHEDVRSLDLHLRRDASSDPVLHALDTSSGLVVAEQLGDLGRAAKVLDELGVVAHTPITHHVYRERNAAFINNLLSAGQFDMPRKSAITEHPHPSLDRLLGFASRVTADSKHPVRSLADLGVRLQASPQTMNNWRTRGVSKAGAIAAEREFGCSVKWVLEGGDEPVSPAAAPAPGRDLTELRDGEFDLLSAFRLLSPELRKQYLHDMAADAVETHSIDEKVLDRLRQIAENGPARRPLPAPISDGPAPRVTGRVRAKR